MTRGKTTKSVDPFLEEKARYFEEKDAEARRLWEERASYRGQEKARTMKEKVGKMIVESCSERIESQIDEFAQEERAHRAGLEGLARREAVNNPPHYNQGNIEVIDAIEDWGLDFNGGNVVKYVARHKHKAEPLEDLKKARWYLDRIIEGYEDVSIKD